jgi:hypothetical protein
VSTAQNNALSMNNVRVAVANWRQQTQEFPVTSTWDVLGDRRPGQDAVLWAYVRNETPYTGTASQRVYFYTDGPGAGPGEGWIGFASLAGLAPGAGAWFSYTWTIPINANAGAWNYWSIVWDTALGEYRSDWTAARAFTVYSLVGTVLQTWPVTDAMNGHTSTLYARVQNTSNAAYPPNTHVYFWVDGPGISGYVGSTSISGLAAGGVAWYGYNWFIPNTKAGGAHTYRAIIWSYSAGGGGWKQVSGWSGAQAFNITYHSYWGEVTQTWPVLTPGGGAVTRGVAGRYWGLGWNSGGLVHDANVHLWFYLVNPSGSGAYIGSVPTTGQALNSSIWRFRDHVIPAGSPLGTYTYYGIFWRWTGSSWVQIGPWSAGRAFGVFADPAQTTEQADLQPMPLPDRVPAPPPLER